MKVIKRDGLVANFDVNKIVNAIKKANQNSDLEQKLSDSSIDIIVKNITSILAKKKEVDVEEIQDLVIKEIEKLGFTDLAKEYKDYREKHNVERIKRSKFMKDIIVKLEAKNVVNQNANVDEYSYGGRRGEGSSELDRYVALNSTISKEMAEHHINNEIYIHDLDSYTVGMPNCDSLPIDHLLKYGFNTRQGDIRPANSISTAFQLLLVLFQSQSLQQFGGVSATHLDISMVPYYRKSFYKHYKDICNIIPFLNSNFLNNISKDKIEEISINDPVYKGKSFFNFIKRYIWKKAFELTNRETTQAVEGMYHNANTLMSRSGNQLPFTSINYGTATSIEGREIIKAILNGSIKGIGKYHRTPIFPCGIFQLKEGINVKKGDPNYDLKKLAIKSTIRRLYPNYANCDWSVQKSWHDEDIKLKEKVINNLDDNFKNELYKFLEEKPQFKEKLSLKIENNEIKVDKNESPTSLFGTMGCVDGNEVVTYKINNNLYVESFKRMWDRIRFYTNAQIKHVDDNIKNPNLYIETNNVSIYDSDKKCFVKVKKIIRNISNEWNKVYFSSGRVLDCTSDHPLPTNRGRIFAKDLKIGDTIPSILDQYTESNYVIDEDIAWLLGIIICDGCICDNNVSITLDYKTENDIKNKIVSIIKEKLVDLETSVIERHRGKKGDYYEISIKCKNEKYNSFSHRLISMYEGNKKNTRHIPNIIFNSDKNTRMSFLAGMIDADGYINDSHSERIQLGSINKELSIQQMLLAQSLGMYGSVYENHYDSSDFDKLRYRIEFNPTKELIDKIVSKKKKSHFSNKIVTKNISENIEVLKVVPYKTKKYSYDVTTESDHFDVSGIWSHNCRTANGSDVNFTEEYYLNQLKGVVSGKISERDLDVDIRAKDQKDGRGNICPCTIILPTIAMQAVSKLDENATIEQKITQFLDDLDVKIHQAKDGLIERYNHIISQDKRAATFVWENGTMAGYKGDIESYMKHGTLAIGQLGLAETLQILIGKNQLDSEGMELAKKIESLYNTRCKEFKEKYKLNFGVYYTPAESLCYTAMKKFKAKYGEIKNISDHDFFTNSIHVPVWEPVDPYKKIDTECQLTGYSNAGCITYVEIGESCANNEQAIEDIIDYAYKHNIPYFAINLPNDMCENCGFQGEIKENEPCPCCGEFNNISRLRRVTGYLTKSFTETTNKGKISEIRSRVKHTNYMKIFLGK